MLEEFRYARRALRRSAAHALVVCGLLALGVAFVVAAAVVLDTLLLSPLPFRDAASLISVQLRTANGTELVSPAAYLRWRAQVRSFTDLAAIESAATSGFVRFDLLGQGPAQRVYGAAATVNTFAMLGATPHLGRVFTPADERQGAEPTVLLSYALWQRAFGADPGVVGRSIRLVGFEDRSYRVVGVMPRGFRLLYSSWGPVTRPPDDEMLWVPVTVTPQMHADFGQAWAEVVGRLAPGVSMAAAEAESQRVLGDQQSRSTSVLVTRLSERVTRERRPQLIVLGVAAACVWIVACIGAANLVLVRALQRRHEFALLAALGAGNASLLRLSILESVLLVPPAVVLGCAGAGVLLRGLALFLPEEVLQGRILDLTWRAGLMGLAAGAVATTMCAAVVAVRRWGTHPADILRAGGSRLTTPVVRAAQSGLMVGQIALSVALLVCTALLVRSFATLVQVDLGFQPASVVVLSASLSQQAYAGEENRRAVVDQILTDVRAIPGVRSAGLTSSLPLLGGDVRGPIIIGPGLSTRDAVSQRAVTPDYFRVMETRVMRGRSFTDQDASESAKVVVVSELFERRYLQSKSALGQFMRLGAGEQDRQIIGVVSDVRHRDVREAPVPTVYVPYSQWSLPKVSVAVSVHHSSIVGALRAAVARVTPTVPWEVVVLSDVVEARRSTERLLMFVFMVFGVIAIGLGSLGIYGVVARTVSQRVREFAVRVALGASSSQVIWLVLRDTLVTLAVGLMIGACVGAWLRDVLGAFLYGVDRQSFWTVVVVVVLLVGVTVGAAAYIPARRSTGLDVRTLLALD